MRRAGLLGVQAARARATIEETTSMCSTSGGVLACSKNRSCLAFFFFLTDFLRMTMSKESEITSRYQRIRALAKLACHTARPSCGLEAFREALQLRCTRFGADWKVSTQECRSCDHAIGQSEARSPHQLERGTRRQRETR